MAVVGQGEPAGGREIIGDALRRRLHRAQHLPALQGSPQIGAPLPVYHLGRAEASLSNALLAARMIGWRYPIVGGGSPGLAYLREESGRLAYAGLSHGPVPERLLDAADLASDNFGASVQKFEPRLIEIPSLRLCALWLCGPEGQNFYVVLEDGQRMGAGLLQIERSIKPRIDAALAGLDARSRATRGTAYKRTAQTRKSDMRLPTLVLPALMVIVAFGARWFDVSALRAWLIDLVVIAGLFAVLGSSFKDMWFGVLVDGRNKISLSRLQLVLWTMLFADTFLVIYIWNIAHSTNAEELTKAVGLGVPAAVWVLMGISGASAAATPAILSAKPAPASTDPSPPIPSDRAKFLDGIVVKRRAGDRPRWSDIILGDEAGNADSIDIGKLQQLLFTLIAIAAYGYAIATTLIVAGGHIIEAIPDMKEGFLALIGASHATYIAYKSVSHTD